MANSYHAFINLEDYMGWIELFGLEEEEPIFQKRILSVVSGAILPIVALGFIKSLTDYIKPNNQVELITDTSPEPLNPQPSMDKETEESVQDLEDWDSTLNDGLDDEGDWDEDHAHDMALNAMVADLSEDDLEELFEVNENPPAPNEELKRAAEEHKESVSGSDEVDVKIDGDTTYVTTKKPMVVKSKNAPL